MNVDRTEDPQVSTKPRRWYEVYTDECPGCGRVRTYKELRDGPKPENPYHYKQVWCGGLL